MYILVTIIHILACVLLILIVLLQSGKMGGLSGIFGGGGSDQLLSTPSGSAFLRKATAIIAGVFFLTTITLTILSYRKGLETVTGRVPPSAQPVQ